ncbi:MAG: Ig-like domain-containing protein, partial [Candidatus Dormibacteraceae bacterium]
KTLSVTQLLTALGTSPAQAPAGGITIIGHGLTPSLIAQGRITDSATGFSSTIDFPDPAFQIASALHASGLPIGTPPKDSPFAGAGTFIPQVVVRNLFSRAQAMTITVEYPQPSGANGAASSTGPAGLDPVAAQDGTHSPPVGHYVMAGLRVPGYATEDFSLSSVMGELPAPLPFCSIRIQYSGAPGSMEAAVSSVEQSQDLVVDAKPENEGNGWAGSGANPWHLDKNTDSVLFLTDMGDKPARIGFSVTANGLTYHLTSLKLNPHETRAIDMRALRDAQQPDFKGNKIPRAAIDGSITWVRGTNVPVMGRLMVIERHQGMASSYDCNTCPCPMDDLQITVKPASGSLIPGSTLQFTATDEAEDCNDILHYYDETPQSSWSSKTPSICTVSGGLAKGVSGGSATISATYPGQYCTYYPLYHNCVCTPNTPQGSATITVQKPTFLLRLSSSCSPFSCYTGDG